MKFLCVAVLVIFTYVPVTHSNYIGPTSWKPTESQNKYVNSNIQNTYQPNGPVLQPVKDPANIPISHPTLRSNEIYRSQPPPIQYGNQIGPKPTYQAPQNVPATQNTVQQPNLPRDAKASTLPAPSLQYSPPNLNLKAIYEASKPTKQYTIVHLNGTVEHTDDLQVILARHPNFVMLKAADVLANKYIPVPSPGTPRNIPTVQTAPIPIQKPAPVTQQAIAKNQNVGWTSTNSYQGIYNNQQPNSQGASLVSNPSPIYPSIPNVKSQQPTVAATPVPISPTPNFQQPISQTNPQIQTNPTNSYLGGSNSQSTIPNSNGPIVPAVPYTVTSQTVPPISNTNLRSLTQINILPPNPQNRGNLLNTYGHKPYNEIASDPAIDSHNNALAANPSAFYPPVQQQNTPSSPSSVSFVSTDISQGKYINPSSTRNLHDDAIAANPLPIYPESYAPKAAIKSGIPNESSAIGAAAAQPVGVPVQPPVTLPNNNQNIILSPQIIKDKTEAVKAINSNLSIPYTDVQNRSSSINIPVSTKPIPQASNIVEHQTLPILLPEIQPQNILHVKTPTIIQESHGVEVTQDKNTVNEVNPPYNVISILNKTADPITEITTSEGSTALESRSNKVKDVITTKSVPNVNGTNTQSIDKTNKATTNSKIPEIIKELNTAPKVDSSSSTIQNVSSESTISTTDKPWSILTLNDEGIWDLVRNNTQNVFFFFMPPRPKVTKESKTIMFANGTTVQEVTETVVDTGSDGEPKMTITTTKSYS